MEQGESIRFYKNLKTKTQYVYRRIICVRFDLIAQVLELNIQIKEKI